MELAYTLSGGAPVVKRYQASATISTAGSALTGVTAANTDGGSVQLATAGSSAETQGNLGANVDITGTVAETADIQDVLVSVIINPDAVWRAKMAGGTASDTALSAGTISTADTSGVTLTGVTTIDDGGVWGAAGANVGQESLRRADDGSGSISVAMSNGTIVGDTFYVCAGFPGAVLAAGNGFLQLTASLDQFDATSQNAVNDNYIIVDLEVNDDSNSGSTNSFYHVVAYAHAFGSSFGSASA